MAQMTHDEALEFAIDELEKTASELRRDAAQHTYAGRGGLARKPEIEGAQFHEAAQSLRDLRQKRSGQLGVDASIQANKEQARTEPERYPGYEKDHDEPGAWLFAKLDGSE